MKRSDSKLNRSSSVSKLEVYSGVIHPKSMSVCVSMHRCPIAWEQQQQQNSIMTGRANLISTAVNSIALQWIAIQEQ